MDNTARTNLLMKTECSRSWYYPLQKGVFLEGSAGMSVREFLHGVLKFDDAYIEGTVRTIFLNNSPVDDIDATHLADGDRMALGSAMPGLVGIVMGRDNPFKSFRDDISARDGRQETNHRPISVSVKLFSTLAVESGTGILERGVSLDAGQLADFLADKVDMIIDADGLDGETFLADLRQRDGLIRIRTVFG